MKAAFSHAERVTFRLRKKTAPPKPNQKRRPLLGYYLVARDPLRAPKQVERSLGTANLDVATEKRRYIEEQVRVGRLDLWHPGAVFTRPLTIREGRDAFLKHRRTHPLPDGHYTRESTLGRFEMVLDQFERNTEPTLLLRDVERQHLERYLFRPGIKRNTSAADLSRLKPFFAWCEEQGSVLRSPAKDIVIKSEPSDITAFTKSQYRGFISFLREQERREAKNFGPLGLSWLILAVTLGVEAGLRRGEVCFLEWPAIDIEGRTIHVRNTAHFRTKNGKSRALPMSPRLQGMLGELHETSGAPRDGFVIRGPHQGEARKTGGRLNEQYLSERFKHYVRKAGLPDNLCFHSTRHTFGTELALSGIALMKLMAMMGHQNPTVTLRYLHVTGMDGRADVDLAFAA